MSIEYHIHSSACDYGNAEIASNEELTLVQGWHFSHRNVLVAVGSVPGRELFLLDTGTPWSPQTIGRL